MADDKWCALQSFYIGIHLHSGYYCKVIVVNANCSLQSSFFKKGNVLICLNRPQDLPVKQSVTWRANHVRFRFFSSKYLAIYFLTKYHQKCLVCLFAWFFFWGGCHYTYFINMHLVINVWKKYSLKVHIQCIEPVKKKVILQNIYCLKKITNNFLLIWNR